MAPSLSLVPRSGTAAGICDLRRLKVKRCGGLWAKALLALDFCPGTLRRAAFAISPCPYHLSHFAASYHFYCPLPLPFSPSPSASRTTSVAFLPACRFRRASAAKIGAIFWTRREVSPKNRRFFGISGLVMPNGQKNGSILAGQQLAAKKQRSFLAGSLLGQ